MQISTLESKSVMLALLLAAVLALGMMTELGNAVTVCGVDEDGQTACKPSITGPTPADPSPDCCKSLSGADLKCLCGYKSSPLLPALGINPELIMGLVKKCSITPPEDC